MEKLKFGPTEYAIMTDPRLDMAGRKTKAHADFSRLLEQLWRNKTPSHPVENRQEFTKIKCGIGPDQFIVFCNVTAAYIVDWQNGQQQWYQTGLTS